MIETGRYEATIGLEVHVQLATNTKIFCGCRASFGAGPNSQTCPVCLGFPGALPVFNRKALDCALRVGLALNCSIAPVMKFDRKNYFYPDLPKNFQISQYELPLAANGWLNVVTGDETRKIRIRRVHLEEDAGKLIHLEGEGSSLIDYNRSGTPLLEIVTEPDIASPQEAYDYLTDLKAILRYLDVSDCNMEEGSLRCDANVSVRPKGAKELGVKAEVKNMNTFKGVKSALSFEIERQMGLVEGKEAVAQETRLWDEARGKTVSMRTKEEAFDYRYFPEPDLPPFTIAKETVELSRKALPELPQEKLERFQREYKLALSTASKLVLEKATADIFESAAKSSGNAQGAANWITEDILGEANRRKKTILELGLKPAHISELLRLLEEGMISGKIAKSILPEMIDTGKSPREIVESKGLAQIKDRDELVRIADGVIASNKGPAEDYKKGKTAALAFLIGEVMKITKGKANPKMVNELLKERIDKI